MHQFAIMLLDEAFLERGIQQRSLQDAVDRGRIDETHFKNQAERLMRERHDLMLAIHCLRRDEEREPRMDAKDANPPPPVGLRRTRGGDGA